MSMKIAAIGVAAAVGLGLVIGTHMRPTLAVQSDAPVVEAMVDGGAGAVDLTPAYVSPASLQAWRAAETPARFEPDHVDFQVRRELARADAELRASEAALEDYHRAAVLVSGAITAVNGLAAELSGGSDVATQPRPDVAGQAWRPALAVSRAEAPTFADERGAR